MVIKSHGARSKSRKKMRTKGNIAPSQFLKEFEIGEPVHVVFRSNIPNKGYPYLMFHGSTGKIIARRGNAYEVEIRDQKARKVIIAAPVHLKHASKPATGTDIKTEE